MILPSIQIFFCEKYHLSSSENNYLKLRLANNLMKCESLGITSGTLKHQYLHGMSLNNLVNLTAKGNFRIPSTFTSVSKCHSVNKTNVFE